MASVNCIGIETNWERTKRETGNEKRETDVTLPPTFPVSRVPFPVLSVSRFSFPVSRLFVSQRFNRIEPRRACRRVDPEQQPGHGGRDEGEDQGAGRDV